MKEENHILPGKTRLQKAGSLLLLACLASFILAPILLAYMLNRPPAGLHGQITVECYIDDSPASLMQVEAIKELEAKYSGPIVFRIIDLRENKEAGESYEGSTFGAVKHAPAVRIKTEWFDGKGERISSGWNMQGGTPKRHLIQSIESAAKAPRQGWPELPLKRK